MFKGIYTAIITPFKNDKFDEVTFKKLLDIQIESGVSGVVPCGTTGESPTLSHQEHNHIIKTCIDHVNNRIQVIAGTGSNATNEAVETTLHAQKNGADAALIVVPYYNKPSQEGLYQHFKKIHDSTNIPIILYNVPGRTITSLSIDTIIRLSHLPRIIGLKDATGDLNIPEILKSKINKDFYQLSGEDPLILPYYGKGGVGCISVTSNIVPNLYAKMNSLWYQGKKEEAQKIADKLSYLNDVLFCESNPTPVKYASSLLGLSSPSLRLPLVEISDESKKKVEKALAELKLI